MDYQIIYGFDGTTPSCIYEPTVGFIPFDEANRDYQAYLLWLAEQPINETVTE